MPLVIDDDRVFFHNNLIIFGEYFEVIQRGKILIKDNCLDIEGFYIRVPASKYVPLCFLWLFEEEWNDIRREEEYDKER